MENNFEGMDIPNISIENVDGHNLPTPKPRKLYFTGDVSQSSIQSLMKDIMKINDDDRYLEKLYDLHGITYSPKPINIYIDSYGGEVYAMFGILRVMENSTTAIHTYCTGCAMSAGFAILISGHKRYCYKYGTPMYHQVSSGVWGKLEDLEADVKEAKRLQNLMEEVVIRKTKISKDKLQKVRDKKKDWYMTAEEALKLGVVDEII